MFGCNGNVEDSLEAELGRIMGARRNKQQLDQEREFNICRSGSAPPTVQGSLNAINGLFRTSNCSGINGIAESRGSSVNPGPPLLSREDWRSAKGFHGGGGCGVGNSLGLCGELSRTTLVSDRDGGGGNSLGQCGELSRKTLVGGGGGGNSLGQCGELSRKTFVGDGSGMGNSLGQCGELSRKTLVGDGGGGSSLFSQPVGLVQNAESDVVRMRSASACNLVDQASLLDRGLHGLTGWQTAGIGARRKSFADILQVGLDRSCSFHNSRPSYDTFGDIQETGVINDFNCRVSSNSVESLESSSSRAAISGMVGSHGNQVSQAFASGPGSSRSRGSTLENQFVGISPVSGFPLVGDGSIDGRIAIAAAMQNGHSSSMTALDKIASLSDLLADEDCYIQSNLHANLENDPSLVCRMANCHKNSLQQLLAERPTVDNLSCLTNLVDVPMADLLLNLNALEVGSSGEVRVPRKSFSAANLLSSIVEDQNAISSSFEFVGRLSRSSSINQKLNRGLKTQHPPVIEPHLGTTSDYSTRAASSSCAPQVRKKFGSSIDLNCIQKAYLETLLAQQNQLGEHALPGKSGCLNQGHRRKAHSGLDMHSLGKSNPIESANFTNKDLMAFATQIRKYRGGSTELRQSDMGINVEKRKVSSLLHEFKTNKTRSFELSDIVDHVVEFSMDQNGSRFIQQKLEAAINDTEKEKIFPEIIPHARTLMTDVFGNYVIQKFFDHGTQSQRAELASQLTGHVLPLSLQMYGCRVIQKALEVVGMDEQTRVMAELDGSVLKCVRDQNGNHVIQKCLECVPEDRIQFIISAFYGQVVPLSTHPYGCRVIQRILEHCKGIHTHQIILDEIMQSVCILAQDQYGNYVIQHVLEHGKAHERSAIISKLAGQIVKMSQQKFASNVVEKCLTYGGYEERQLLVNEMLGNMDENEPLQAMMKDPYGNYVVQKVLETCSDKSLELILCRIKVHLNALKRYTYGKHIVARVEKLIMTGERRRGLLASLPS